MVNQQVLAGKWDEVRGKIKERWGKLTDDDVRSFNGNFDQLVGHIQHKTGESREAIEEFLGEVTDRVEERASQAAEGMRQGYGRFRQGFAEAEKVVQHRPAQSLAIAFGLGLVSGLGIALLLRDRSRESKFPHGRVAAEHFGRQMLDTLSSIMPELPKRR